MMTNPSILGVCCKTQRTTVFSSFHRGNLYPSQKRKQHCDPTDERVKGLEEWLHHSAWP